MRKDIHTMRVTFHRTWVGSLYATKNVLNDPFLKTDLPLVSYGPSQRTEETLTGDMTSDPGSRDDYRA